MFSEEVVRFELETALDSVQSAYGRRDLNWTPMVVFHSGPSHTNTCDRRTERIAIIKVQAGRSLQFLRFDLLHECTHVLNPWLEPFETSNLEEAAAIAISLRKDLHGDSGFVEYNRACLAADRTPRARAYYAALTDLEGVTTDVFELVKKLRGSSARSLSRDITPDDIMELTHKDAAGVAHRLCDKFNGAPEDEDVVRASTDE